MGSYWIARHPVTVAQFAAYLSAAGVTPKDPNCLKGRSTAPVVFVNWREAAIFCDWLSESWRDTGLLPDGWSVRLPSEPEWEKAARGGFEVPEAPIVRGLADLNGLEDDLVENPMPYRSWPWDDRFDDDACHHAGQEVYRASPAGCFPSGSSPYGCEDLSGNVLEWTRSAIADYPYPEQGRALHEREAPGSDRPRVLRGGAFYGNPRNVRCAYRSRFDPVLQHAFPGVRNHLVDLKFGLSLTVFR